MLQIYNNLTRQKEVFKPIEPGKVGIYVCGITVYDFSHIGHARTYTSFDVITRYLRFSGYDVTHVRNITDIDDNIINRARENDESFDILTARIIDIMHADFASLNILPPDIEPRATETIDGIIEIIETLIAKDFAYVGSNNDVYYRARKFPEYGRLSGRDLDQLRSGERVEVAEQKEDSLDFVLWKAAKPGEPTWDSPWGEGRPGWHIECSAMSKKCLGETFDIHGGGSDLQFPHHENEIAQSEAANGCKFVNTWIHTGMVQVDKEKMSKSLGNFFTIRDVLKEYRAESLRYFLLNGHYRSQVSYSQDNLQSADASVERLYNAIRGLDIGEFNSDHAAIVAFKTAMDDDFNVPEALAVLFELSKEVNRLRVYDKDAAAKEAAVLKHLADVLGLLQQDPEVFLKSGKVAADGLSNDDVDALVAARVKARADKDWAQADEIRKTLESAGIELEDAGTETSWRRR